MDEKLKDLCRRLQGCAYQYTIACYNYDVKSGPAYPNIVTLCAGNFSTAEDQIKEYDRIVINLMVEINKHFVEHRTGDVEDQLFYEPAVINFIRFLSVKTKHDGVILNQEYTLYAESFEVVKYFEEYYDKRGHDTLMTEPLSSITDFCVPVRFGYANKNEDDIVELAQTLELYEFIDTMKQHILVNESLDDGSETEFFRPHITVIDVAELELELVFKTFWNTHHNKK